MRADVGHWYARSSEASVAYADCKRAAEWAANRRGAPEMAHNHRAGEPCTLKCVGFVPREEKRGQVQEL